MLMPSHAKNVKLYKDTQPIFTRYGIESQLDAMFSPTVQLRSGGYIVLNQTEALVAIDVNSGRSTREHHIEDTALKTNLEAAEEIARQLRLRDLAGLIVIDFIDMDEKRNNRTVERRLKDALRNDRARIQVGRISHFGLLEMSRQRIRTSVLESSTEKCPHCGGTGHVRSVSSVALQLLRSLEETLLKGATHNLIVRTRPEIALYVLNHKRAHLRALEERFRITITVNADREVGGQVGFTIDRGEQVMTHRAGARRCSRRPQRRPPATDEEEDRSWPRRSTRRTTTEADDRRRRRRSRAERTPARRRANAAHEGEPRVARASAAAAAGAAAGVVRGGEGRERGRSRRTAPARPWRACRRPCRDGHASRTAHRQADMEPAASGLSRRTRQPDRRRAAKANGRRRRRRRAPPAPARPARRPPQPARPRRPAASASSPARR